MRKIQLSILLLLVFNLIIGQTNKLENSRRTSFYTYIFKITDKEAKEIYLKDLKIVNDGFFHSVVDSFKTDKDYNKNLPNGHYLFAYAEEDQLVFELKSIGKLQVKILNNKTDLVIHLHDSLCKLINDAKVYLRDKNIPFNNTSQSYKLNKTHRQGLLAIDYLGYTSYHILTGKYKARSFKNTLLRIVFGRPLGYVTFLIRDPIFSIKHRYAQGWVRRAKNLLSKRWWENKIDNYDPEEKREKKFEKNHSGFLVFSKPRYRQNDTVKFKAFLFRKGKPVKKEVGVYLSGDGIKGVTLSQLKPYRAGAYEYSFVLTDSLKLKLGGNYNINLENKDDFIYTEADFKFEDYELKSNSFTIRSDKKEYYKGDRITLISKGLDENDLNLYDAKVNFVVTPLAVQEFTDRSIFIADTLYTFTQKLDNIGDTKIILPDSIFPNADMGLNVSALFTTSNNESHLENLNFIIHYQTEELRLEAKNDSIVAQYFLGGKIKTKEVELVAFSGEKNEKEVYRKKIQLPYTEMLSPYINAYKLISGELHAEISISSLNSDCKVFTDRRADSLFIQINNPRHLPYWYTIYKKNEKLIDGFSTENLNYKRKSGTNQNYFISLQYIWNNQIKEEEYEIPLTKKQLTIETDQPLSVSPGQILPIKITVKDIYGKPVKGADVTASGITKKFPELSLYSLPEFNKKYKSRKLFNSYTLKKKFEEDKIEYKNKLNWKNWKNKLGLDSIAYFKFLFPEKGLFKYSMPVINKITQFAPYVVLNGQIVPIYITYIDKTPIYFYEISEGQRYSFPVDSGFHRIEIRISKFSIKIDSVYFKMGNKLILSVDPLIKNKKVYVDSLNAKLSNYEKTILNAYTMPVENNNEPMFSYLKQDKNIFILNKKFNN